MVDVMLEELRYRDIVAEIEALKKAEEAEKPPVTLDRERKAQHKRKQREARKKFETQKKEKVKVNLDELMLLSKRKKKVATGKLDKELFLLERLCRWTKNF
jgi:hypothetical protein